MSNKTIISNIRLQTWPITMLEDDTDIYFDFSNDRHHALKFKQDMTPDQIAEELLRCGECMKVDIKQGKL